jgi:hypothetical protein
VEHADGAVLAEIAADATSPFGKDRAAFVIGVAGVDDDREFVLAGEFELPAEGVELLLARGDIAKEIEADFADSDELTTGRQLRETGALVVEVFGLVGVESDDGVDAGIGGGEDGGLAGGRNVDANLDDRGEAGSPGASHHAGVVVLQFGGPTVGVGVDCASKRLGEIGDALAAHPVASLSTQPGFFFLD